MWDKVAAIDLRAKAEYYLVEHKPEGIERSAQVEADRNQLRLKLGRAYCWQDVARHKKAVDELVLSTLKEYATWRGKHWGETAGTSG